MKISVLVVTYNREIVLKECLESIKKQTFKDFEVILVDDGSTDNTKKYKNEVDVYFYQDHGGISKARNKALELMSGDYFFIMDSDDILRDTALKEHLGLIESTNSDLVFGYYEYFGSDLVGQVAQYYPQNLRQCLEIKKIPHCGLYRTATLGKFRYDPTLTSAVDYDYILNILKNYPEIKMKEIPKALYLYRTGHKQERNTASQIIMMGLIRNKYRS